MAVSEAAPTVTVSKMFREGRLLTKEESATHPLEVLSFRAPPAKVGVDLSQTINMGNFESVRISVSVEVPCYLSEVEDAYAYASAFCKARLVEEKSSLLSGGKDRKKSDDPLF